MRMQLSKGPTITPAMFPINTGVAGSEPTLIGFSGMTELDYVATHLCAALIQKYDPTETDVVTLAVNTANALLMKSENMRQLQEAKAKEILEAKQQPDVILPGQDENEPLS